MAVTLDKIIGDDTGCVLIELGLVCDGGKVEVTGVMEMFGLSFINPLVSLGLTFGYLLELTTV